MVVFLFSDFRLGGSQKVAIDIFNSLNKIKPNSKILTIQNEGILKKYIKSKNTISSLKSNRALSSISTLYNYL